jgi:hypothetical protein
MAHLRTFQTGPRAKLCQDFLNQLSAARVTLLDPDKKAAYDAQLKEQLAAKSAKSKRRVARALPLDGPLATATPLQASSPAMGTPLEAAVSGPQVRSDSSRHRGHRKKGPPWVALGMGGALLAVVTVVTMMAMSGGDEPVARRPKKTVTRPVKSPGASAVVGNEPNEIDPPENKTTTVVPKKVAATGKLPEYLRANKFDETPTDVVKRKEKPVNPFAVAPIEKDPPAKIEPQPKEDPPPVAVTKQARPAVPPDEALKKADAEIREVFDFKAATDLASRKKMVTEILSTALKTDEDPVSQFAMLRSARDLSVHLGDYVAAEQAINEMSQRFDIDTFDMRSKAIMRAMTAKVSAEQRGKVARAGLALAKEFHQADRYKEAATIITAVGRAAARLKENDLVVDSKQLALDSRAMAKQYALVRRAMETLKTKPDDPAANTSVGKYLCFAKGDWERGLPKLTKGDDARLKELAARDLQEPVDTKEQVALGDAWWEASGEGRSVAERAMRQRAAVQYQKAMPTLVGIVKARVEKRLAKVTMNPAGGEPPKLPPGAIVLLTFDRKTYTEREPNPWYEDQTGKHHHGVIVKRVLSADGVSGEAAAFGGEGHIIVPGKFPLGAKARSIAAWVRVGRRALSNRDPQHVFNYGGTSSHGAFGMVVDTNRQKYMFWGCGIGSDFRSPVRIDTNWHHHAITYDGAVVRHFIDGREGGRVRGTLATATGNGAIILGVSFDGAAHTDFYGHLDELAVYDRALSEKEVGALYELGRRRMSLVRNK